VVADLVPERFVAEGLAEVFPTPPVGGGRVLLARAEVARSALPDALRAMGWDVDDVPAYRTVPAPVAEGLAERIAVADAVTFTSSSTVTNLVEAVGVARIPPVVATIGPVTSATAAELGLVVAVEADPHTTEALVEALTTELRRHVPDARTPTSTPKPGLLA
jgi:uroporphyrinogen III methyltransferase/synthase